MSLDNIDYVIVGGGAAGSVLAARLSEDPACRVLLVEAGPDLRPQSTPSALRSANPFRAMVAPHVGVRTWPGLAARRAAGQEPVPYMRGRGLGGSTTINGQIMLHAAPEDFEEWRDRGCEGWGAADVAAARTRLDKGPIPITPAPPAEWGATGRALREAALANGYGWCADANAPHSAGVSPVCHAFASSRVSASDAYLEPVRDRENLTILCDALVDRVLFEDGRAVAVTATTAHGESVLRGREIVLAAGVVATPGILVRSGVGPASDVARIGAEPVVDLPVGVALRDHAGVGLTVTLLPEARVAGLDVRGMTCCVRYTSGLVGAGRNDMMLLGLDISGGRECDLGKAYLLCAAFQTFSSGSLRVVSSDPSVAPEIEMGLLSDERDLVRLRDGMRRLGVLIADPAFDRIAQDISPVTHNAFCDVDSGGFTIGQLGDDEALDAWLRETVNDTAHAVGTCPMGPDGDPSRVVDPECRVVGVDGLRVIDASVMPTVPRANTQLPTLVVAEHMAQRLVTEEREREVYRVVA